MDNHDTDNLYGNTMNPKILSKGKVQWELNLIKNGW